ncbi:MAG: YlbE-like family protein [Bacilli bacterium]|nr:YlbE-like family protein [Bacilli bacterium]
MNYNIQFKIKGDPLYQRYIRENSHWYKILNRNPERFNDFIEEIKTRYKLRPTDKLNNILDKIRLVQKFMSMIN